MLSKDLRTVKGLVEDMVTQLGTGALSSEAVRDAAQVRGGSAVWHGVMGYTLSRLGGMQGVAGAHDMWRLGGMQGVVGAHDTWRLGGVGI